MCSDTGRDSPPVAGLRRANLPSVRLPTALIVQNDSDDPPARLGEWLLDAGLAPHVVAAHDGVALPDTLDGYAALVVLGGGMSANDDDTVPWFGRLKALLRQAVDAGLPVLGVCLGGQLLAAALGGRVERGPDGPEIGPALVAKRDLAAGDPLFASVPFTPDVVQWHHDGITELPPGAVLLASSPKYPNQAFRVGETAYGLQFHIETTPEMVRRWADRNRTDLEARGIDRERLLARLEEAHADVRDVWEPFTRRFAELAHRYHRDQQADGDGDGASAPDGGRPDR